MEVPSLRSLNQLKASEKVLAGKGFLSGDLRMRRGQQDEVVGSWRRESRGVKSTCKASDLKLEEVQFQESKKLHYCLKHIETRIARDHRLGQLGARSSENL